MNGDYIDKIKALMDLNRYNQAIKLCLKHLYSASEDVDVLYYYLIECYWNLDDYKNMEKFLKEALVKFPEDDDFYRLYSQVFLHKKMYDEAIKYIDKALKFNSSSALCYYTKADILNNMQDFKEAKKCILKALNEDSTDVDYLYTYALILCNQSDEKYKEIIDQILKLDPHNADALALRGEGEKTFWGQKLYYLKALKLNPFDKDVQGSLKDNKLEFVSFFISAILSLVLILLNSYYEVSYGLNLALFLLLGVCFYILSYHPKLIFFFTYAVAFNFLYESSAKLDSFITVFCCASFSYLFWGLLRNRVKNFQDFIVGFKNSLEYRQDFGLKEFVFSKFGIIVYSIMVVCYLLPIKNEPILWVLFIAILPVNFAYQKVLNLDDLEDKVLHLIVYCGFLYLLKAVSNILFEVCQKTNFEWFYIVIVIFLAYLFVVTSDYEKEEDEEK